ncbi:MAG: hypothetical protein JW857_07270 [Bacteroidales bacterium]|nr:hypothetical protein [Bacteroidales bacterium]
MNPKAKAFYQQEFEFYSKKIAQLSKQNKRYSTARITWFLLGLVFIYLASSTQLYVVALVFVFFLLVFLLIALRHEKILAQKKESAIFLDVYTKELSALYGDFSSFEKGMEFIDNQHPYTSDLDVFGKDSLFQMLNRNFSKAGNKYLAHLLKTLENNANIIRSRQEAIQELSKQPKWISRFRALGIRAFSQESAFSPDPNRLAETLPKWIIRQSIFKNKFFRIVQYAIPMLSIVMLVLYLLSVISSTGFIFYVLLNLGFTGFYSKQINQQHQELGKQSATLFRFQALINAIENTDFRSDNLRHIQKEFSCKSGSVSRALKQLGKITQAFDMRLNILVWPILNYFFLWDIRQSIRLELWKSTYEKLPNKAFNAIAEMEMLVSFATFYYNRSDLIFPQIVESGFVVEGEALGHPLMSAKTRVDNDVRFPRSSQFIVITGANMAGKSTYLRTVGVNLLLALVGSPVCAKQFKTSILQPFTSIKTSDSLSNNESYFYAELLRLQRIITALKTGKPYFIILDEILKGTNSKDKEQGSKALVKQLIGLKTAGIIATHDLQLADLKNNFPENVKTACFEVEINKEQLVFDYKLREGVSQNLNATFLMEKMGIS